MKTKKENPVSNMRQESLSVYERPICEVILLCNEGLICSSGDESGSEIDSIIMGYENGTNNNATLEW